MERNNEIRVSNEDVIKAPGNRKFIPIEETEWNRLERMIIKYSKASYNWLNVAVAFLSAALGLFTSYITLDAQNKWKGIIQIVTPVVAAIGVMSLIFFFIQKRSESTTKDDILEQMKAMKNTPSTQDKRS